ncbi:MAG: hypothetical protein KDD56_04275 [Bdellovibrionales bacterium]|nr:hypothetical protein [Bdellovibrionales bacterium]
MKIDRRVIFLFVALALGLPLALNLSLKAAPMKSAEEFYQAVEALDPKNGKAAFVAFDFGPNTKAENESQAEVVLEHLLRKRIPVILFSQYVLGEPFLKTIPARITEKIQFETGDTFEYGKDWVNLGYQPGASLIIQAIPKTEKLADLFVKDVRGNRLSDLPIFKKFGGIEDISLLAQFTGLVGVFDSYIQFFQNKNYRPVFTHGCTSITIPEAFIYLDSGQLTGLLEGVAGAAWYSELLSQNYPNRKKDKSTVINTGLGVAHLVIILFVILGNISYFLERKNNA